MQLRHAGTIGDRQFMEHGMNDKLIAVIIFSLPGFAEHFWENENDRTLRYAGSTADLFPSDAQPVCCSKRGLIINLYFLGPYKRSVYI